MKVSLRRRIVFFLSLGVVAAGAGCAAYYPSAYTSAASLAGSTIEVTASLSIPDYKARVYFQKGELLTAKPHDRWTTYCSMLVQDVQYPGIPRQVVSPGEFGIVRVKQSNDYNLRTRTFVASRSWTYDPPSNVTYKIELRLNSSDQPHVRSLICEKRADDYGYYHPNVQEARTALGDWVAINTP